jgi:hypothetical protein
VTQNDPDREAKCQGGGYGNVSRLDIINRTVVMSKRRLLRAQYLIFRFG